MPVGRTGSEPFSGVTVVVRESGERTANSCVGILRSLGASDVVRVSARPFSKTLREGLLVGIEAKRPWTLCIDADVLPMREGLLRLLAMARRSSAATFELQGLVFDKFFAVRRPAGNHLYRTQYLSKAIALIPEDGRSLRPESAMIGAMGSAGFRWIQSRSLVGAHDFEQHYSDVYGKCFLQAHKHRQRISYLSDLWAYLARQDDDFRVALAALSAGVEYKEQVFVSRDFGRAAAQKALRDLGLQEKSHLKSQPHDPSALCEGLRLALDARLRRRSARLEREAYPLSAGCPVSELHRWFLDRVYRLSARVIGLGDDLGV